MSTNRQPETKGDWLARLLCLAISAALGLGALLVRETAPAHVFWPVASVAILYAFVAIFGPRGLRRGLLAGFPGSR